GVAELRARVLAGTRRTEEAGALLKAYAEKHGGDAVPAAAGLLDDLGLVPEAEQLFRTHAAASKDPTAPLPLARHLARRGRLPEALDLCEKALPAGQPEAV